MKKIILCFLLLLSNSFIGCTSVGVVDHDASVSGDESVFVIGVSPENYRIMVFPGHINKNFVFERSNWRLAALYAGPNEGFVVGKAAAGDTLAITNIRVVKDRDSVLGADFAMCDSRTMVFQVPAGKVIYLGDVHFDDRGRRLGLTFGDNFPAAKEYVAHKYPKLRDRLEPWKYDLLSTDVSCVQTVYIPTTPPRR